jgi:hypothetical protein
VSPSGGTVQVVGAAGLTGNGVPSAPGLRIFASTDSGAGLDSPSNPAPSDPTSPGSTPDDFSMSIVHEKSTSEAMGLVVRRNSGGGQPTTTQAVDAAFASMNAPKFNPGFLWGQLNSMDEQMNLLSGNGQKLAMLGAVGSAGIVLWSLRGYYWLGSCGFAAVPGVERRFQQFDFSAVLDRFEKDSEGKKGKEETLQSLVA